MCNIYNWQRLISFIFKKLIQIGKKENQNNRKKDINRDLIRKYIHMAVIAWQDTPDLAQRETAPHVSVCVPHTQGHCPARPLCELWSWGTNVTLSSCHSPFQCHGGAITRFLHGGVLPALLRLRPPSPDAGPPAEVTLAVLRPAWWLGPNRRKRTSWPGLHLLLARVPGCDGAGGLQMAATGNHRGGKGLRTTFHRLHAEQVSSRVALSCAIDLNTENHGKCVLV